MPKTVKKSILELGNGIILELADHELKKILANIADPNTDYKKVRKLNIELKFVPNEDRSQITVSSGAKTTLAPNKPNSVTLYNTEHKDPTTGEVKSVLKEVTAVPPGQMSFDGLVVEPEIVMIG